jgi:ATP-dependent helicase HrpB
VVVATNVAETSLTIDGIRLVIDSGLARKARFDPYRGINTLLIEKISRASAEQRAGRAGRTAPGRCLRLWTERDHNARPEQELPEVLRVDLSEIVLHLKALGIEDVAGFPWLDSPGPKTLTRAMELLIDLGALSSDGSVITELGRRMLAFPLHPRHARMLIEAGTRGCVPMVALMAAVTQMENVVLRGLGRDMREKRADSLGDEKESDLFLLVRAWQYARESGFDLAKCRELGIHARAARQAERALQQFMAIAKEQGLDVSRDGRGGGAVRRCVLTGFVDHLARRTGQSSIRYDVVHKRRGTLDKESVVRDSDLVVATSVQEIGTSAGETEVRLSQVTAIEESWLRELFPHDVTSTRAIFFDPGQKRVRAEERVQFRDLVIGAGKAIEPTDEEAARVLASEVAEGRLVLKQWDHAVEQWILRLNRLAEWCPELGLPPLTMQDRQHLFGQICLGARGAKDVKDGQVWPVVKGWLSQEQAALLDQHAPERITLSNGRTPKVIYDSANPPYIAVQIQHLYGMRKRVTIAMGRVNVLIHILAPSQRPVQITDDLSSFWDHAYAQVKKELQRKYPKHEWR